MGNTISHVISACCGIGIGEIAPLAGLSKETLQDAEAQLRMICRLVHGKTVPYTLTLFNGRVSVWLRESLGLRPTKIYPSVKFGLEAALISALAKERGLTLADVIVADNLPLADVRSRISLRNELSTLVGVNGLMAPAPEGHYIIDDVRKDACELIQDGFKAIKIKVGRG